MSVSTPLFAGHGDLVCKFAEDWIIQTKGRWAGKPLMLEEWQRDFLNELFIVREDGSRVYREALLGIARKNGKSTLSAAIGLYMLLAAGEEGPEVYAAAASRDQARIVFGQAQEFVEASPRLRDWLTVQRSAIICKANHGVFRVLASDAPKQYGLNPSGVVIDELWAHANEELYFALTTGQLAREQPLVVSITTAGFDPDSICGQLYQRGCNLKADGIQAMRDARFLFKWFQVPDEAPLEDESLWLEANPSSWIGLDDLRHERGRLPENVFRRLHGNQWTESEDAWLPPGTWDDCLERGALIPEGAQIAVGVDIGTMRDSSAVVKVWKRPDGRFVPEAEVFTPSGHGQALELPKVEAAIARAVERYDVIGVAYDPWTFERSAQDLTDRGLKMESVPQSPERMAPMSQNIYEAIVQKEVAHNGDPVLAAHVRAGATKEHERGWRLVKGKSKHPIDALIAMTLALSLLRIPPMHISDYRIEPL